MRRPAAHGHLRAGLLAAAFATTLVAGTSLAQQDTGGSFVVRRVMIHTLTDECARLHPDMAVGFRKNRDEWLVANQAELASADAMLAGLPEAQKAAIAKALEGVTQQGLDTMAMIAESGESGEMCASIVSELGEVSETGQFDASSYDEALGMFRMHMLMVEIAGARCRAEFPSRVPAMDAAQEAWRDRDAGVIAVSESAASDNPSDWARLDAQGSRSARTLVDSAFSGGMGEAFCERHFDELAAGAKRDQNPKMYAFLENGPNRD